MIIALAGCLLLCGSGCRVSKNFTEGQTLLKRNVVKFINDKNVKERQKSHEDLQHVVAQQPNKRVFGFMPFRLWLYTAANNARKENKTRWWIKNKVGEAPVIFDSLLTDKSDKLMAQYLQNYGYLYAEASHTIATKKKKTTVTYNVKRGPQWHIGSITYPSAPFITDSLTQLHKNKSVLKKGDKFQITGLKAEQARIETDMKNNGFYFFGKEYVVFELDTSTTQFVVNINIRINQPNDSTPHQQYWINEIYVTTDYGSELIDGAVKRDTVTINEYHFINKRKKIIKPQVILDNSFLKHDELYSKDLYVKTQKALSSLLIFKFVSVEYTRVPGIDRYLNCVISMTPGKRQTVMASAEANINYEGFFGVAGTASYKNKNLTKRSDLLAVDVTPGVQFSFGRHQPIQVITKDVAVNVSYYFNKFLFPFSKKFAFKFKEKAPKTRISIRYNYEQRYDFDTAGKSAFFYTLHGFNASFGYEWNQNAFIRHVVDPINFTLFLLPREGPYFLKRLNENSVLKSSYEEQIILGPSYTFIYNNQISKNDKRYMYFRTNLETAGNVLMAGFSAANAGKTKELPYKVFNKDFSEFVRGEFDLRGYVRVSNHSVFAGRSYLGIAFPYGNSVSVPFTRQFSSGGPNSLRGFLVREVGPGGYLDPSHDANANTGFFNQTGDMKMEGNVELRFDIFKWFKGAIFADAGNVWLVHKDSERPLADFAFNRFWKEFAVDVGAGLRLDFNYFVIRVDYGMGIRDPSRQSDNKWYFNKQNPGRFQLAVGYPF
ncbi:MAG: outer membrane protein assembly complex, YaeT protein [Bacteroidetes bacterium]|nr:outer membrane protein assembly complex, YaeT protein [Bacteroidota bacterium]